MDNAEKMQSAARMIHMRAKPIVNNEQSSAGPTSSKDENRFFYREMSRFEGAYMFSLMLLVLWRSGSTVIYTPGQRDMSRQGL